MLLLLACITAPQEPAAPLTTPEGHPQHQAEGPDPNALTPLELPEALPFTALLVVFFAIVAVIHDQHLFTPIIDTVLAMDSAIRPSMFFLANGLLSMISDNVFVATVFVEQLEKAFVVRSSGGDAWVNQTSGMPCSSQIDAQACNDAVKLQYDQLGAE